jgi:hypothetical protein
MVSSSSPTCSEQPAKKAHTQQPSKPPTQAEKDQEPCAYAQYSNVAYTRKAFFTRLSQPGSLVSFFVYSHRKADVVYAGGDTKTMFGLTPEETKRKHPFSQIHPNDAPHVQVQMKRLQDTGVAVVFRFRKKKHLQNGG